MSKNLLVSLAAPIAISLIAGGAAGYFATYAQIHNLKAKERAITSPIDPQSLRAAILANPEMIEEAFYALQDKRKAKADAAKRVAMANAKGLLYDSKLDPILGAKDAPFVLVEFFDYNCGFCKIASKWIKSSLEDHPGKIKVIMKDFPILEGRSKGSRESSAAAWAVRLQGQDIYEKFHFALMNTRGGFDSARIDEIAASVGVNVERMRADMKKNAAAFDALMEENMALARQLGIDGTPAFVTGDTFISGANTDLLQSLLDKALSDDG